MRRLLALLLAATACGTAVPPATAAVDRFAVNTPRGVFTMAAAQSKALAYDHHAWPEATLRGCSRATLRVVQCFTDLAPVQIIDGQPLEHYRLTLTVTRSGSCPTTVTHRTGSQGVASGKIGPYARNCFTGPLVVIPTGLSELSYATR